MRIGVAQTRPVKGDIRRNVEGHKGFVDLAVSAGTDALFFPELSVTGYEPELAGELAIDPDDARLDDFQRLADAGRITVGVGAPTRDGPGVRISTLLFGPHEARRTYSKRYLHPDEEPFFVRGGEFAGLLGGTPNVALAICYELSVPEHAHDAVAGGAEVYVASVAKTAGQVEAAIERLSEIARGYSMTVLMANCVGPSGGGECGGRSSVWNRDGSLVGQLDGSGEGLLVFDTETRELIERRPPGR